MDPVVEHISRFVANSSGHRVPMLSIMMNSIVLIKITLMTVVGIEKSLKMAVFHIVHQKRDVTAHSTRNTEWRQAVTNGMNRTDFSSTEFSLNQLSHFDMETDEMQTNFELEIATILLPSAFMKKGLLRMTLQSS